MRKLILPTSRAALLLLLIVFSGITNINAQNFFLPTCSGAPTNAPFNNIYGPLYAPGTINTSNVMAVALPLDQVDNLVGKSITGIYFYKANIGPMTGHPRLRIWLSTTSTMHLGYSTYPLTNLVDGTLGSGTLVYDGNPSSAIGYNSGWKKINFNTPYLYAGIYNLLVCVKYENENNPLNTQTIWAYENTAPCITPGIPSTRYGNSSNSNTASDLNSGTAFRPYMAFDYTTPPCSTPLQLNSSSFVFPEIGAINISFSANVSNKYLIVRTPGTALLNTLPANGTVYSVGSALGNGTIVSFSEATSMHDTVFQNTTYTYTLFPANVGCAGGPIYNTAGAQSASATSLSAKSYTWNINAGSADGNNAASWTPVRNNPHISDTLIFNQGGSSTLTSGLSGSVAKIIVTNNTSVTFKPSPGLDTFYISKQLNIASGSTLILGDRATLKFTSGSVGTADINGTLTLNGGGTTTSIFRTANAIVNVSGTINVANNGVITGTPATLFMNAGSIYNHNRDGGTIPPGTYNAASTINITGTTATVAGWSSGAKVGNVNYNCSSQVNSVLSWQSLVDTIRGNLTINNTGAGSIQLGAGNKTTVVMGNFTQNGGKVLVSSSYDKLQVVGNVLLAAGTLDLSSGTSTAPEFQVGGSFTQNASHTITETGTGAGTLTFNGITTQIPLFNGTRANSIGLTIDNIQGVLLNYQFQVNANATITMKNGTLSGTGSLVYNLGKLSYNGSTAQTTTDFEFPATSGPQYLTISNAAGVTLHAPRTLNYSLNLIKGRLNTTMNNLLTLGSVSSGFYFSSTPSGSSDGYVCGPLAIAVKAASNISRTFAIGDSIGFREVTLSSFHTGNTPQVFVARVIPGPSGGTGTQNLNARRYFEVSNINSIQSATKPVIRLGYGADDYVGQPSTVIINQATIANGVYANIGRSASTTSTITSDTTALLALKPNGGNYFVLSSSINIKTWDGGAGTNNWGDSANWFPDGVPTITESVWLKNGDSLNIDVNANAYSIKLDQGAMLAMNSNTLTVDSFIVNNGTFNVSGGNLKIGPTGGGDKTFTNNGVFNFSNGTFMLNGSLRVNADAAFIQSGGDIKIDGNAGGVQAISVKAGTTLVSFSSSADTVALVGGNLIIVDPSISGSSVFDGGQYVQGPLHTLVLGDGLSVDSGSVYGFTLSSNIKGNLLIGANSGGINRHVSGSYTIYGNLVVNSGGEFRQFNTASTLVLMKNITVDSGGILTVPGTLSFGGSTQGGIPSIVPQTFTSNGAIIRNAVTSATASIGKLVINNSSGIVNFNTGDISYSETLTFIKGKLFMNNGKFIQATGGTVNQYGYNTGWVVGTFQKYSTTGPMDFIFPIGDSNTYTPFLITAPAGSVTTAGNIEVSTNTGTYGNIATSSIVANNSINRYFSVHALNGITFAPGSLTVTMFWGPADIPAGANTSNYILGKYSNGVWMYPNVTDTSGYYIQANGISSFSDFVAGSIVPVPLSVKLSAITAKNVDITNHIDWTSASEEKGGWYEIERSLDGVEFTVIGNKSANGIPSSYTYEDATPIKGINFYRIKILDKSGSFIYSKVVTAFVGRKDAFAMIVYPNPANNKIAVDIAGGINDAATITITDIAGHIISTIPVTENHMELNLSSLSSGTYFAKYNDISRSQHFKIIKL